MDFDLTDRQKEMKKELSDWLKEEIQDHIPLPRKETRILGEQNRTLLQRLAGLQFYLPLGIDPGECKKSPYTEVLTWVLLGEELAKADPSLFLSIEQSTRLFGWIIARYGNEKQIKECLTSLQKGQCIGAVAMAESSGNFPEKEIKTEGQKEGDFYRLLGRKRQVINAPIADWLAVTAKTQGQWAVFLVKPGQEGLTIGEPLKTLGYKGLVMSEVTLDHCFVSEDRVIGPFPDPAPLTELGTRVNLMVAMSSLGVTARALQGAKKHSGESQNGGKPVQAYQEIRFKLAEMFSLWQTSQWMVYRAAWLLETRAQEAKTIIAAAKVFVTEAAEVVAREAMQIMAGEGYMAGNEIEECFRDARFGPVAGETSECLRMRIADDCLAKYK
jgi:alkylation response protein AidB-like acyl-CoA dehydrogenase